MHVSGSPQDTANHSLRSSPWFSGGILYYLNNFYFVVINIPRSSVRWTHQSKTVHFLSLQSVSLRHRLINDFRLLYWLSLPSNPVNHFLNSLARPTGLLAPTDFTWPAKMKHGSSKSAARSFLQRRKGTVWRINHWGHSLDALSHSDLSFLTMM